MNNKDILQNNNAKLNNHNTKLSNILDTINSLSKNDNILSANYIQDGLIAWFDGEDTTDENFHWNSRVGEDYIYSYGNKLGNVTSNPFIISKYNKEATNNFVHALGTSIDYYNEGNTIEVVGRVTSKNNVNGATGGWLIASNNQSAFGIGVINDNGEVRFLNDADQSKEKTHTGYYNKTFGASLYLKSIGERGISNKYDLLCSVNGENWYSVTETANSTKTGTRNWFSIMCYYTVSDSNSSSYAINGGVNCIRIYNRQLTNEEIAHNHAIDKVRFNLDE